MGMAPITGLNLKQIGSMLRRRREEQGMIQTPRVAETGGGVECSV